MTHDTTVLLGILSVSSLCIALVLCCLRDADSYLRGRK